MKYRENLKIFKDSNINTSNKVSQEESSLGNDRNFLNADNESFSVNFKGNEKKTISASPSQLLLPKINNPHKIPQNSSKIQKSDMQNFKIELDALEKEEYEIKTSLEKINLQAYKLKLIASLQTIHEESREMEESLKKTYAGVVTDNKRIGESPLEHMKEINLDLEPSSHIQPININLQNESDKNRQLVHKSEIFCNITDMPSRRIKINREITPETINIRNQKNIMTNSHYLENKKKLKRFYGAKPEKNKKPIKTRFVSRDFVRVNPNIDIKSLLLS